MTIPPKAELTVVEQAAIAIDDATCVISQVYGSHLTPGERAHLKQIKELLRELGNSVSGDGPKL